MSNDDLIVRNMDSGRLIGLIVLADTFAVFVGSNGRLDIRYSYKDADEALRACMVWNGEGDPPGNFTRVHGELGAWHLDVALDRQRA